METTKLGFVYGFPPITMLRAHRPVSMDFLGTDGRVLRHQSFSSYPSTFEVWLRGKHGPRMRRWVIEWSMTHHWRHALDLAREPAAVDREHLARDVRGRR